MSLESDLLDAFESHSPEEIRAALDRGADPVAPIKGKPPIDWLIEYYPRSARFAACLRVMLDACAVIPDPLLQAILLDDAPALRGLLAAEPGRLHQRFHMECTFTPLRGVSALHVAAEYNSVECARALIEAGLDVNVRAGIDEHGFGGHTPLFHTLNNRRNYCRPTMELLVESGASLDIRLKGLTWGAGFDWETLILDVTPLSYAQCGLYHAFQRYDTDVYAVLSYLYEKRYGSKLSFGNVPNRYLDGWPGRAG